METKERVDDLIVAGNRLDAAMDMQQKRDSGEFHITADTASRIWVQARKEWAAAIARITPAAQESEP